MFRRAGGFCEARCGTRIDEVRFGHLDHFFGRGKVPESYENCWALCPKCDELKTLNKPDAQTHLRAFLNHACRYYVSARSLDDEDLWLEVIDRALIKLAVLRQKGRA